MKVNYHKINTLDLRHQTLFLFFTVSQFIQKIKTFSLVRCVKILQGFLLFVSQYHLHKTLLTLFEIISHLSRAMHCEIVWGEKGRKMEKYIGKRHMWVEYMACFSVFPLANMQIYSTGVRDFGIDFLVSKDHALIKC